MERSHCLEESLQSGVSLAVVLTSGECFYCFRVYTVYSVCSV